MFYISNLDNGKYNFGLNISSLNSSSTFMKITQMLDMKSIKRSKVAQPGKLNNCFLSKSNLFYILKNYHNLKNIGNSRAYHRAPRVSNTENRIKDKYMGSAEPKLNSRNLPTQK